MESLTGLEATVAPTNAEAAKTVAAGGATVTKTVESSPAEPKVETPVKTTAEPTKAPATTPTEDKSKSEETPSENEIYRANYNKFIEHTRKAGAGHLFEDFKAGKAPEPETMKPAIATEIVATVPDFDPYNKGHLADLFREVLADQKQEDTKVLITNAVTTEKATVTESFQEYRQGLVNEGLDPAVELEILNMANARVARFNIDVTKPGGFAALGEAVADQMDMEMQRRGLTTVRQKAEAEGVAKGKLLNSMTTADAGAIGDKESAPVNPELKILQDAVAEEAGLDVFLQEMK